MTAGSLEHVERADHVRHRVLDRVVDRHADVGLGGEVEDGLRLEPGEEVLERLADVSNLQVGRCGDVLALALHQGVDDDDLVAAREERIHDMGADEPGSACDDRAHSAASYGERRSRRS